ncbi:terminase small subunit [Ligilactobacillus salivarius]|uniref:terminase small subunit n=1 Tax=Ligilactobacillus salivarius TaxID=1624 RepID=UPI0024B8E527|nr:terminase small subunit [Ligilactobacillus salivarius]
MGKLTNKQQAFINYYLGESKMNATDAARRAGYKHPKVQGAQNLSKLNQEIAERMEQMKKDSIATQEELLQFMTAVTRGEETEKLVTNAGAIVEVPVSMKDRIKTAELLGKSYGMFTDKKEINASLDIDVGVGDWDADN